jgi:8-oxo-dGTP pyrophosphatase MutT (NUDIX family)
MIWNEIGKKKLVETPPFSVEEVSLFDPSTQSELSHKYYRLQAPSWVNIFAITQDKKAILVRQPRVGIMAMTLEVPGGCIDGDEEPVTAAARELEEETGYRAGKLIPLGSINPNPAIMSNRLFMFLATECYIPDIRSHHPDAMERIEILRVELTELESIIQQGQFENALGALTVLKALNFHRSLVF